MGGSDNRPISTASELSVALDLTRRGYQVYAPIVGVCHSCDLIAVRGTQAFRIEVRTCRERKRKDGKGVVYTNTTKGSYDILARVVNDVIHYSPMIASD